MEALGEVTSAHLVLLVGVVFGIEETGRICCFSKAFGEGGGDMGEGTNGLLVIRLVEDIAEEQLNVNGIDGDVVAGRPLV